MNISRAILTNLAVVTVLLNSAIAWAEDKQITYTLNTQSNGSYRGLVQQAESLAEKLIEEAFARNPRLTEVGVSIIGERNGQEVPLLAAKVSRNNWQETPQMQAWTQYFSDSAVLLGFKQLQLPTNVVRPQNSNFTGKEVAASHLEPNFYQ
ncbi:MAG: hypothetical protein KME01_02880 [Chroococcus sp. CMT-3BRIN-NPC107]|jgi:hypothetical protein|nr:hypothetical protein [Chroococcus sp. CMT-3BRIN-NPC107]